MATSSRRVRVKRPIAGKITATASEELDQSIQEYMKLEEQIVKAQARQKEILECVKPIMEGNVLDTYMTPKGVAEIKVPRSNMKNVINVREFREITSDEDFYSAVTVSTTAAKKVVAEKTLDKITEKIKPEPKPPVCVIRARTAKDGS